VHPVRCLTDALIVPLDGDAFARRLQAEPELLTDFLRARAAEEYRTQARITVLARLRPTARLCHLVLDLRQRLSCRGGATPLPFPLTYRQLASLIGASRSQVAASLAELRDRGWASLRSGCLFIDDAEKMVAACEFEEFLPGAWGTEVAPGPGRENAGMAGPFLLA
jgi:CRP-like cAMP-binding protein